MFKRGKYNAVKTVVDGITFDSKKEAARYAELNLLERAGEITCLTLQPRFDIIIKGKFCCFYKADFKYFTAETCVIEDVKGMKTPMYRLKKKLVEAQYGIKITET